MLATVWVGAGLPFLDKCAGKDQATWTAMRVTCNFESSPHRDRNAPGSMNAVAPISWFKEGKIWVEGEPPEGYEGPIVNKEYRGQLLRGHYVGGAHVVAQFDPSKAHSVEPSVGDRRVVVAYSPRLIDRLEPSDLCKLKELGFSVPSGSGADLGSRNGSTAQAKGGDRQEHGATEGNDKTTRKEGDPLTDRGEEDSKAGVLPGGDGSNSGGWRIRERLNPDELEEAHREFVRVRNLEIESRKFLDEQLEFDVDSAPGSDSGSEDHPVSHVLQMKVWVRDLEKWLVQHDAIGQLHDGMLGDEDTRVLTARLCSMNLTCPGNSGDNPEGEIEVPLSDEPFPDPQDSRNQVQNAADQWQAVPAGPLQTVTISNKEFLENLSVWRPCAEEELSSIFETHRALRRTTQAQVDALVAAGVTVEVLPAKAIFQRKAVSGRNKCRVVACGNYESGASSRSAETRLAHYAGGLDAVATRAQLRACGRRVAAGHDYVAAIADVRTAFLRAPLELPNKVIVLRPPKVLIAASLAAEGELWIADGAIYGLQASPAAWGRHRDAELQRLELRHQETIYRLEQARGDKSIWILREKTLDNSGIQLDSPPAATLGVYVDDLLVRGPRPLVRALLDEIANRWMISDPKFSDESGGFTFCGIQVEQTQTGLEIHQCSYIEGLLEKYPDVTGHATQPLLKEPEESWTKDGEATLERLRLGQKLVGEVLWISTMTRPDIAYATSRLGQLLMKDINYALAAGYELLRYLRSTRRYRIVYGAPREHRGSIGPWQALATNCLELFADASFCAGADRSQSGMILQWNDAPVAWLSLRQPPASLSTAEAELQSSIDCMTLAEGFTKLLQELEGAPIRCVLYGDNQGAVTVLQIPQGAWRTRHLRLKAAWFLEQVEHNKYPVHHVPGQFMLGDLCTKTLNGPRARELLMLMGVAVNDKGESVVVRNIKSLDAGSGGVSIKPEVVTLSESTSGLENSGADSGGVDTLRDELIDTALEELPGEGAASVPMTQSMSMLKRGLRMLVVALCLKRSQGKVVVTIEDDHDHSGSVVAWLVGLLVVLGTLLVRVGCGDRPSCCPRIQRMRAEESGSGSEDSSGSDDWSLLSRATGRMNRGEGLTRGTPRSRTLDDFPSRDPDRYLNLNPSETEEVSARGSPQAQGLSRRTRRACNVADPVPPVPRNYLNLTHEDTEVSDPPQAQGLDRAPQGPHTSPDPAPQNPRYLDLLYETPSDRAGPSRSELGSGISERGDRRTFPPAQLTGLRTVAEQASSSSGVVEIRGDRQLVGAVGSHLDDALYVGLPQYAAVQTGSGEELERHTSEEDEVARNPIVIDHEDPTVAPVQRADVEDHHHADGREQIRVSVYPGWVIRTPPRELWPPQPDWGGWTALWHQNIPRGVTRDFYFWDRTREVLVRMHAAPRRRLYLPSESTIPTGLHRGNLTGRRRSFVRFIGPTELSIIEDRITDPRPQRQLARQWTGRTELKLGAL